MKKLLRSRRVGCYHRSLFTAIAIATTTTLISVTRVPPFAAGFRSPVPSVSALRTSASSIKSSSSTMTSMDALAADLAEGAENLFAETPLIRSQPLSALVGKPVYLKLDAMQASGSFKVSMV